MAFLIDPLSCIMIMVVTGVGSLIHLYSIGYMHGEEGFYRFFAYLNLFCMSMLLLVLGSNMLVMLFVMYFMFTGGRTMENSIRKFIPLHQESVIALAHETKHMVKANAIGIPLISLIQGFFAWAGYLIFGMEDALMWGFLTGIFAFFPIVGTMMIWVPLVVYLYSKGMGGQATGRTSMSYLRLHRAPQRYVLHS